MNFKKHILALTCSVCLLLSMGISASAQMGTVTADVLNIRSSTSVESEVLSKAAYGDELELLTGDGTWYKVLTSDGITGYVSSEYITPGEAYYGVVTASKLIVRSSTSVEASAITTIPYGSVVELLAYDGFWYKIRYGNGESGYVSAEYISLDLSLAVEQPYIVYGYISATNLNIRETTSLTSSVLTTLPLGTSVEILAYDGLWYKLLLADGQTGYASADYVSLTPVEASVVAASPSYDVYIPPVAASPSYETYLAGEAVIQTAYEYLGRPYVWSAAGPDAFDCSGFTMYVMNLHGVQLPHQSGAQYNYGYSVEKDNLIPGDLVFFNSTSKTTVAHVGIYVGEGYFIHASSGSAYSVTVSSLSDDYYTKHYLGARRIL